MLAAKSVPHLPVTELSKDRVKAWVIGDSVPLDIEAYNAKSAVTEALNAPGFRAIIWEDNKRWVAGVDRCGSIPLFWGQQGQDFLISPDAHTIHDRVDGLVHGTAVKEAAMTGYVTGPETLYQGVQQIQAGHVLEWDKEYAFPDPQPANRFLPHGFTELPRTRLIDQLLEALTAVCDRIVAKADGKPIVVPLSGSLSARFMLAMLHARGDLALSALTFGARRSVKARLEKRFASDLGIPTHHVPLPRKQMFVYFGSEIRSDFWAQSHRLSARPNDVLLPVLKNALEQRALDPNALIVLDLGGDAVSGAALPSTLFELGAGVGTVLNAMMRDHYRLWTPFVANETRRTEMRERVRQNLATMMDLKEIYSVEQLIGLYQCWLIQERFAKYELGALRTCEGLRLRWDLPYLDSDLLTFWMSVPGEHLRDQSLFKEAIALWDGNGFYRDRGLLRTKGAGLAAKTSKAAGLVIGRKKRDKLAQYARYLDRNTADFTAFGFDHFAQYAAHITSPEALYTRAWLDELELWDAAQ